MNESLPPKATSSELPLQCETVGHTPDPQVQATVPGAQNEFMNSLRKLFPLAPKHTGPGFGDK